MKLEPPHTHHLHAAEGWLELGNCLEAGAELDQLPASCQHYPEVLEMRWRIHAEEKDWEKCVAIGAALVKNAPDKPESWIHRSFALHELRRTREAYDLLKPAVKLFPRQHLILYNLACYDCRMGNLADALTWLAKAVAVSDVKSIKALAVEDPDLEPLKEEIGRM